MKKRCNLLVALAIAGTMSANAQVRIGGSSVPNPSAVLDLNPDDRTSQGNATLGLAMPRVNLVTTTNPAPLAAHVHGMTVFNMADVNDVSQGFYYNDGIKWIRLLSGNGDVSIPTQGINDGDVLVWNESTNQWEARPEQDGIIGNEVVDATDSSLTRSGEGTTEVPYTLAVSESGIETKHLKDGAVTTEKIVNNAITTEKITNNAVTREKLADNSVTSVNIVDNSVTNQKIIDKAVTKEKLGDELWNEITQIAQFEEVDGVIGNEVVDATDGSLTRSGAGTAVSPYTLAVSEGGIETRHLKDGAVTNNKIVDKIITKEKLGDDVWNQVKTEIINLALLSEVDGVIGNEVVGSADASLTRSGDGTAISPYRLAVSESGIETKHLKDGAVTTEKIINNAITTEKIINKAVTNEKLADNSVTSVNIVDNSITNQKIIDKAVTIEKLGDDVWNEITQITQTAQFEEVDGVIGNEVVDATDGSLTRSGLGTAVSPYTLAVSEGGIETKHLKNGAVTTEKIVNNAITTEKIISNAVTNEKLADNSITNQKVINKSITKEKLGDDVWNEITQITQTAQFEEVDGVIGNEVVDATDGSLTRSGLGTAASPYTLAVSVGGIETKHLEDGAVTTQKIVNNAVTAEKIINNAVTNEKLADNSITNQKVTNKSITKEKLGDDVWNEITQIIQTVEVEEVDGIIGNEVVGATDGSLTRSGAGTAASPYTLAVSNGGIETKHLKDGVVTTQKIANNTITTEKLANAESNSILYTNDSNQWTTFTRKVVTGVFNVPNDSILKRCALTLPDFGAGLYGIHIVCDADLPLQEGELIPSFFRFITDIKPYGVVGTRDVYFDSLAYFSQGDSHTTTAWLYDCKPLELELYCTNAGNKPVSFRIVCSWLMPF